MNRKNRLRGIILCIIVVFISGIIAAIVPLWWNFVMLVLMFIGGYALRETLDMDVGGEE